VIAAGLLTLFYLPVHLILGIKASESFKHPVGQFIAVLTWPVLVPIALLFGVRFSGAGRVGLSGSDPR
jgi:hypothetical protein